MSDEQRLCAISRPVKADEWSQQFWRRCLAYNDTNKQNWLKDVCGRECVTANKCHRQQDVGVPFGSGP